MARHVTFQSWQTISSLAIPSHVRAAASQGRPRSSGAVAW
jgi:hypothetical protein